MPKDKYTAVWVSHTSISDFLSCPRAYYLKHVYKDPKTGHKIKVMTPHLALGQAVHAVLEGLSVLPRDSRFSDEPLLAKFKREWVKVSGKQGGFWNQQEEDGFYKRGEEMLKRVYNNPGPLKTLAVKITQDLPYYWLSEADNIILCGKIDWLEYLPDSDSVHIIDFKTGKVKEESDSLQLPIYQLLVTNCQERNVSKASYWYLTLDDGMTEQPLPDQGESEEKILSIARDIKLARQLEKFDCPRGGDGCFGCQPMEKIVKGQAEYVGQDEYRYDVYILPEVQEEDKKPDSVIL